MDHLSREQIEGFLEVFNALDYSKTGKIGQAQLRRAIEAFDVKPTESEIVDLISIVDVDGSGTIDFDEFLVIMTKTMRDCDTQQELQQTFNWCDKDRDNVVSATDLTWSAKDLDIDLTEAEGKLLIQEALEGDDEKFTLSTLHNVMNLNIVP